jgi:hypothetical protein
MAFGGQGVKESPEPLPGSRIGSEPLHARDVAGIVLKLFGAK